MLYISEFRHHRRCFVESVDFAALLKAVINMFQSSVRQLLDYLSIYHIIDYLQRKYSLKGTCEVVITRRPITRRYLFIVAIKFTPIIIHEKPITFGINQARLYK